MAPKFTAPEPFTGTFAGIEFENGVGTADVDEAATAVLVAHGYTVEATASAPEGDPSDKWTADQLKDYAKTHDITVSGNKGEVLKTITDTLAERKAEAAKTAAEQAAADESANTPPAS